MEAFCRLIGNKTSHVTRSKDHHPIVCQAKFEEVTEETTDPFSMVISAMNQLIDDLVGRIDIVEQCDNNEEEDFYGRDDWK